MPRDEGTGADPVPLLHGPGAGPPTGDAPSVEVRSEIDRRGGGAGPRVALTVVAGLAAVIGLLWAVGSGDGSGAGTGAAADGGPEPASGFSLDAGPPPSADRSRTSIRVTPAAPAPDPDAEAAEGAGPVLDEPTGLTLFTGGGAPLQAVDLDSGRVTVFGIRADPVAATGGSLVLYQADAGLVGWVPLDDPGQQAAAWRDGPVALGEPGSLWALDVTVTLPHPAGAPAGSGRWDRFDLGTSRVVARIPGDRYEEVGDAADRGAPLGGAPGALRPNPHLSVRPDGVYRYGDAGYTRLGVGRVVAGDEERALLGACEADGPCDLGWVEVATGAPLDLPLPAVSPRVANLVADGRWLHSVAWDGTSELLELDTGRRIEHDWETTRPTLSGDGRWLAEWFGTTVVISDLGGGGQPRTAGWVEDLERDGPGSLLLVAGS